MRAAGGPVRVRSQGEPAGVLRIRFNLQTLAFPPVPPGSRIRSLTLLFDEGTEVPTGARALDLGNPSGIGLTTVDNIFVGGKFIRRGTGIAPPNGNGDEDGDEDDD